MKALRLMCLFTRGRDIVQRYSFLSEFIIKGGTLDGGDLWIIWILLGRIGTCYRPYNETIVRRDRVLLDFGAVDKWDHELS